MHAGIIIIQFYQVRQAEKLLLFSFSLFFTQNVY